MKRESVFSRFSWLKQRGLPMVVSADLEGLLAAALLHHHLSWQLAGFDDGQDIWLTTDPAAALTVRVNLGPAGAGPAINRLASGSQVVCNPQSLSAPSEREALGPFPFSVPLFLLWLHDLPVRRDLTARLIIIHAADAWLQARDEPERILAWQEQLPGYDWEWLFQRTGTALLERRMADQLLRPLRRIMNRPENVPLGTGRFNPDWDGGMILDYLGFVGTWLKWSPPPLPQLRRLPAGATD